MKEQPSTIAGVEGIAGGKYLTFLLDSEVYGVEILKVQEIIGLMKVTRVPRVPEYVRGVINLRGKVIPVVDQRLLFSLDSTEDTERTCIVVLQMALEGEQRTIGIVVDEVSEVLDIDASSIEPAPRLGSQVDTQFLLGIGMVGENVIQLLDINRVLTDGGMAAVSEFLAAEGSEKEAEPATL